jgi:hypothetical protein
MCVGRGGVRGQKLASRAKVWSALSTPTPDFEYSPTRLSKKFVFPLRLIIFIHSNGFADFAVYAAAEGDQEPGSAQNLM